VIYSSNGKGHASCVRYRVQSVGLYGLGVYSALRWGWVFLEQTRILSGIQFTRHLIEFDVVEKKIFVGNVNMILDAANLQPALEHVCGKQTPSANIVSPSKFAICS